MRSQLSNQPRLVPFIDQTRLYIGAGLTAANMQHYAGLGELDVMGFLMHYIRSSDLFVDVGANLGIMTVLASGVAGARTVAIEPDVDAHVWLKRNVLQTTSATLCGVSRRRSVQNAANSE